MSRTGALVGLVGVAALAGAIFFANSLAHLAATAPARNVAPPAERVRVEVLNAGGVSGQARAATIQLRDLGFDVVHFGNASSFDRDSSAVVDRVGRVELAEAVASALGISQVISEADPNLFVDVTVLLGSEWRGAEGSDEVEEPESEREPWDPRAWIGR